jgi:hypothetical protein
MVWGQEGPIHSQFNWATLLCDVIPDGKTEETAQSWHAIARRPQNCPFQSSFTQRTAQSLRESYSFLSLPADTTMASSQGTSVSSNSFNRWTSHDIFLFEYYFLLHILRYLVFFSNNIMADVASKQQTTALFLSTIVTRTRRHTEPGKKKKTWKTLWETCAVPENIQFSFSYSFLNS